MWKKISSTSRSSADKDKTSAIQKISVQYAKARVDPLFTDRTQRLNKGKLLAEDVNLSKEYCRRLGNFFLIVIFTAFTYRKILTYGLSVKNFVHMSCH